MGDKLKRGALIKHLKKHGCFFVEHETKHDLWQSPDGKVSRLKRQPSISKAHWLDVCKQLGIPKK